MDSLFDHGSRSHSRRSMIEARTQVRRHVMALS
jgi:hypothetical protein